MLPGAVSPAGSRVAAGRVYGVSNRGDVKFYPYSLLVIRWQIGAGRLVRKVVAYEDLPLVFADVPFYVAAENVGHNRYFGRPRPYSVLNTFHRFGSAVNAGQQLLVVGREGGAPYPVAMVAQYNGLLLQAVHIPQAHRLVFAGRSHECACMVEPYFFYTRGVTGQGAYHQVTQQIVDLDNAACIAYHQAAAFGREGNGAEVLAQVFYLAHSVVVAHIPQVKVAVFAGAGNELAVGAQVYRVDLYFRGNNLLARAQVRILDALARVIARVEPVVVGCKRYILYSVAVSL